MKSLIDLNFLQKSEDALIPQPFLPHLGEGKPDFKVPLPNVGEGFRVRAGTFARGLLPLSVGSDFAQPTRLRTHL